MHTYLADVYIQEVFGNHIVEQLSIGKISIALNKEVVVVYGHSV